VEYYVITQLGKQMIPQLRELNRDDEADILDYLQKSKASTTKRISDDLPINEPEIRLILINLVGEGWVKRRRTKGPLY